MNIKGRNDIRNVNRVSKSDKNESIIIGIQKTVFFISNRGFNI